MNSSSHTDLSVIDRVSTSISEALESEKSRLEILPLSPTLEAEKPKPRQRTFSTGRLASEK
jgi:hypothetical protein